MKRILSLIFVLAMCFCLFSCGEDSDVPAGMQLASRTDIVDYKLFVPMTWTVTNADSTSTQAYVSDSDRTNVLINQWNMTENTKTVSEWWEKEHKPGIVEMGIFSDIKVEKDKDGKEGENMTLDGKPAIKYTYTALAKDAYFKFEVIGCVANGSIYVMQFTYMQDIVPEGEPITFGSVDYHKEAVDSIIANFKFN